MIYRFIIEHAEQWPIERMCSLLDVSSSAFHTWRSRKQTKREQDDEYLRPLIREAFDKSHGIYGSPRVYKELVSQGHEANEKQVARLMKEMELVAVHPRRRFVVTTDSDHNNIIAPNLLQQNFTAAAPNTKWVGDITYIDTDEGWLYLATVIDLFSRKVVGWAFLDALTTSLITEALTMAINARDIPEGLLFHSDRGCQYTSAEFRSQLKTHGIIPSNSRKGCCYDNAVAESFFHSLKTEWVRKEVYPSHAAARSSIFSYIEGFYNRTRRHSTISYLSPNDFEAQRVSA